ncbi:MAG: hypothetical protein BGO07_03125 [Alphaproteobacteria bacterium 40-19]|nr:MAG: hypothetical protein BGO07_03125 [Alphaproteobacteria bacterium 40-19]
MGYGGGPWFYTHLNIGYGLPVDKNDSRFFIPPLHALTLLEWNGEFHARSKLPWNKTFGPFVPQAGNALKLGLNPYSDKVCIHPDFCYIPEEGTPSLKEW